LIARNGGIGALAEQEGHHILVSVTSSVGEGRFSLIISSVYILALHVLEQ
jgi:hypothetical protein